MPDTRRDRWRRYGHLGSISMPRSALKDISQDKNLSDNTRQAAKSIDAMLVNLGIMLKRDLIELDKKNAKSK